MGKIANLEWGKKILLSDNFASVAIKGASGKELLKHKQKNKFWILSGKNDR